MQYLFRNDRGYLKDAAPRSPHFASWATLKVGGRGGELNLEPQTHEPIAKPISCKYMQHLFRPPLGTTDFARLLNKHTKRTAWKKTTKLNERRRTTTKDEHDDGRRRATTDMISALSESFGDGASPPPLRCSAYHRPMRADKRARTFVSGVV